MHLLCFSDDLQNTGPSPTLHTHLSLVFHAFFPPVSPWKLIYQHSLGWPHYPWHRAGDTPAAQSLQNVAWLDSPHDLEKEGFWTIFLMNKSEQLRSSVIEANPHHSFSYLKTGGGSSQQYSPFTEQWPPIVSYPLRAPQSPCTVSSWRRDGAPGWGACPAVGSADGEPQRAQEPMSGHLCSGASGRNCR